MFIFVFLVQKKIQRWLMDTHFITCRLDEVFGDSDRLFEGGSDEAEIPRASGQGDAAAVPAGTFHHQKVEEEISLRKKFIFH